jgi:hypothetical protein
MQIVRMALNTILLKILLIYAMGDYQNDNLSESSGTFIDEMCLHNLNVDCNSDTEFGRELMVYTLPCL